MSGKNPSQQPRKVTSGSGRSSAVMTEVPATQSPSFFPFARYTSVVGVHTSLLAFTAFFLPRTSLSSLYQPTFVSILDTFSDSAAEHELLPTLTENPLRTVLWLCVGTLILQIWWSAWVRGWSLDTQDLSKGGKIHDAAVERTKQKLQRQTWNSGRFAAFRAACSCTVIASVAFAVLAMLFGAPLYSHYLHTYLLGFLVSLLTVFTPVYTLGAPSLKSDVVAYVTRLAWIRLFAELSPRSAVERAVVYPAVGAILGCWSGAMPAGLDWEEPWQRWPLTSSYGAIGGFILGSLWALGVSATENLANLDRPSYTLAPPSDLTHQPQRKPSKKLKSQ